MKHVLEVNDTKLKVKLSGKLYAHDAGLLREDVLKKIETGINEIYMDLTELSYIDSTGLGVFITIHKRLQERGKLLFSGAHGLIAELLKRTRLDKVLDIEFME